MLQSLISSIWALDSSVLPCLHHSGSWLLWKPCYFLTFLIFHSYWMWPYLATYHWSLMLFPGVFLFPDENFWWLSLPSTLCSMFPSGCFPMVCPAQSALLPLKNHRYSPGHTVWHHSQCNWIGTRTHCLWIWWERLANETRGKQEFLKLSPIRAVPKPILSGVMRLFKGTINYSRKALFWASSISGRTDISFSNLYMSQGPASPLLSKDLKFDSALCFFMKLTFITFRPCLLCFISKIIYPSPHSLLLTGSGLWAYCWVHQAFPCFRGNSNHITSLYKT